MTDADVDEARTVGQITWSDLATRDLGKKVRYPMRPRQIIEAYMWLDPQGCLVAEDSGSIIGASYAHVWGRLGWVGPFEVLPHMQNKGVGTLLLRATEQYFESRQCRVLGLETMPHIMKNIHFYMRAGYRPSALTLIAQKTLGSERRDAGVEQARDRDESDLGAIAALSAKISPHLDYRPEVEMSLHARLGPVFLTRRKGQVDGFAALHAFHRPDEADHVSLRVLAVDPDAPEQFRTFEALLGACEGFAWAEGRKRIFTRFLASNLALYDALVQRGYRLEGSNLRMVKPLDYVERDSFHLSAWAG
jgi:GNAT superfamily N-acetyltransferase